MAKWKYSGDINLECGGFYWLDDGSDYIQAVVVTPCSDAGGPDNLFHVDKGHIFIDPAKAANMLDVIGMTPVEASRDDLIYAAQAYGGIERDFESVLRFGKDESEYVSGGGWNPSPDTVLRRNTNLRKYVEREFLNCE